MVTLDFETALIIPGLLAPRPICMAYAIDGNEPVVVLPNVAADLLAGWLASGETFVGANIAFDFAVACAYRPELIPLVFEAYAAGRVRDTQIRQQLLDIRDGCLNQRPGALGGVGQYALASLAFLYLHVDRSKDKLDPDSWRRRYIELEGVPLKQWPQAAVDYVRTDVLDTRGVFLAQGDRARDERYLDAEDLTSTALVDERRQCFKAWALHLISCWGTRTDGEYVEELEDWATTEFRKLQDRMFAEGLYRLEPLTAEDLAVGRTPDGTCGEILTPTGKRSSKSGRPGKYVKNTDLIRERVLNAFDDQGLQVPRTDKGAVKTDADTMRLTGDDLLEELAEGGPIGTVLRTFVPTLKQGVDVPINTRYRALLETGRISSSNPNLANLPREIKNLPAGVPDVRQCFVPRPGFLLCSVDYEAAELRALAQACLWLVGFSDMAEFFQREPDGDPHLEVAAEALGITVAEAKARYAKADKLVADARQGAKADNFGWPGGLGPDKWCILARKNYGVQATRGEALARKARWLGRWREMSKYFNYVSAKVGFGGARVMQLRPGGKQHRERGGVGYCDAANGYFQGLIADGAGDALSRVSYECYVDGGTALYGSRPVAFLYDEIICEVPEEIAHEAALRLRDVMVGEMRKWLPDVPVTAEPALMRRWYKKAKAVYENGRLVPWEPK